MAKINVMKGENPLINCNFLLRVESLFDIPCRKVTGITQEKEYETIQSGGVNDYVFLRQKPMSKTNTFQIERYICTDFMDPLPVGMQTTLPMLLYVSRYPNNFVKPQAIFSFTGCTVMSKSFSELDAAQAELLVETTIIAYQQVFFCSENNEGSGVIKW
ncbi:MAG: hypothetical protein NC307_07890 [Roseburia sp.]|nr:hypothetical protein [Roseburia sp.]